MNFDFSSEHRMIQEQVQRFLSDHSPLSVHRAVMEGEQLQANSVWTGMGEMGLQGTAIPEAYGGVGEVNEVHFVLDDELKDTIKRASGDYHDHIKDLVISYARVSFQLNSINCN